MDGGARARLLADLEETMQSIELSACSSHDLQGLAREVHAGQRLLEGYLSRIANAARASESAGQGATATDVVSAGGDLSRRRAKQLVERVEVAAQLPQVAADLDAGAVRGENIDAIARRTRRLSSSERARLASVETELAERARSLPPETFEKYLADVVRRIADVDDGPSEAERQRAASSLAMGRSADGMWWLRASLDGERGAEVNALLQRQATALAGGDRATPNDLAAALHEALCRPAAEGARPAISLGVGYIVDALTLQEGRHDGSVAETWDGEPIDPAAAGRLACDADCYAVLVDQLGRPTSVGRTRRRATREQRLQLRALYSGCPLDGTAFDRCEIHHVNVPWERGGETELDNLLPISLDWHHRIHDRGWTLKMAPDRSLKLWRPDGTLERSIGPPTPITRPRAP